MKLSEVLTDIGRPIAYYPGLRKITGSTNATIFICQLIYWHGKQADKDGWIFKDSAEIEEETGLSYDEQFTARKRLLARNLIAERNDRLDHKMYFKIKFDDLDESWNSRNRQHGFRETEETASPEAETQSPYNSNSEITSETTTPARTPVVHDLEVQDAYTTMSGQHIEFGDQLSDAVKSHQADADRAKTLITGLLVTAAQRAGIDIDGYPEDVAPWIVEFCRLYHFHPPAMHTKAKAKKGNRSSYWIEGTREVIEACGEFGLKALYRQRKEYEDYMASHNGLALFEVSSPKSIVNACAGVAAKMRSPAIQTGDVITLEIKEE
jgi:hypothetical protein